MISLTPSRSSLVDAGADARPARRAAAALDIHAHDLGAALRRAVPFFVRRGIQVAAGPGTAASLSTVVGDLAAPSYVLHLATDPGGFRSAIVIDATANAFLLDGALGGDGSKPPDLDVKGLSGPQSALVGRIAQRVAETFSTALSGSAGFGFTRLPPSAGGPPPDTQFAALKLALGDEGARGTLMLLVSKEALHAGTQTPAARATPVDPRIASTMQEVEIDLVVELGRIRMSLGDISALRVGDMLKLDVPLDGTVLVRSGGQPLLEAFPTTSGSRLAVRIAGRHGT
jgi:flagellar motor switch protein FliM